MKQNKKWFNYRFQILKQQTLSHSCYFQKQYIIIKQKSLKQVRK